MPDQNLAQQLGLNIAKRRKKLGLTQAQLSEVLDIGQDALSRMEKGRISPKINRLPAFAEALECSVAELFCTGDENNEEIAAQITEIIKPLSKSKQHKLVTILSMLTPLIHKQ